VTRLPPPVLGVRPLGALPDPGEPIGTDPILGAYDDEQPAEPADVPGLPIGPDEVTAFLVGIGDALAQLRGPHWQIEPDETAMLAPAVARQLAKPDNAAAEWLMRHGDALLITVGLGLIIVPRAAVEYQVIRYRRRQLELAADLEEGEPYAERFPGATVGPDAGGAGPGLPADGLEGAAARPTDPVSLAATLGALTGR